MGSCLSVSISADQAVNQVSDCLCREASYVHKLGENLEALEGGLGKLMARRADLLRIVEAEEVGGSRRRLNTVEKWLSDVQAIKTDVDKLLADKKAQLQRLCLCGYFSKDCRSSRDYGKIVLQESERVKALEAEGNFGDHVTGPAVPPSVDEIPTEPTVGLETLLEKAWKHLMKDEVGILGLYGMGGVGKTTLLTQINNKFHKEGNGFHNVIWVLVSANLQIQSIQKTIGEKLGLRVGDWERKERSDKAIDIHRVLKERKFVLLLDDIWEEVILADIGVPKPDKNNGCKVVFTTRSRDVCGFMGAEHEIEVECLAEDVAWDLFQKKVGESTLNSHRDIPKLARRVARKCHGLPLALNIIGRTMARKKSVPEWRRAINVLTSAAGKFSGMQKILSILEFSYDNLEGDEIRSCFLYCALFPEDHEIDKADLVGFWLGEGLVDGNSDWDTIKDEVYDIIGILVRACLLLEDKTGESVKMHDVVREMALWIASDSSKQKEKFFVKSGVELRQIPNVEDWKDVTKMSLMKNKIKKISDCPNCPKLSTLLASNNELTKTLGEFFLAMPNLVVLDLSWNLWLEELPEEISKLVSLKYLNLYNTDLRQLPSSIKELRRLIFLNLAYTSIQSIDGIPYLSNLIVLGLEGCLSVSSSVNLMDKLQLLGHLQYLSIMLEGDRVLERFLSVHKLTSAIRSITLRWLNLPLDVTLLDGLETLKIDNSEISDIKIDWGRVTILPPHNGVNSRTCFFRNLSTVNIYDCSMLRDLTWLLFAPHLKCLNVQHSKELQEIISREKVVGPSHNSIIPFQALTSLTLSFLRELKSVYWSPLPFPCLVKVKIMWCRKLKKLPLNCGSAKGCNISIEAINEWMEEVEWEDEATRERLYKGFQPLSI